MICTKPQGLEVRINFATGKKEARYPEGVSPHDELVLEVQREEEVVEITDDLDNIQNDVVRNILKFLPESEIQALKGTKYTPSELTRVTKLLWEKRQKELKEVMDQGVDNADVTAKLLQKAADESIPIDDRVAALLDIEYHVSDVDNAADFISLGGLGVLKKLIVDAASKEAGEDIVTDVVSHGLWVFGTCIKHSPTMQSYAHDIGFIDLLNGLLLDDRITANENVMKKVLYSLSSVLSGQTDNQLVFGRLGGAELLGSIFESPQTSLKIRARILTVIYDVIMHEVGEGDTSFAITETVANFTNRFRNELWCSRIGNMLYHKHLSFDELEKTVLCLDLLVNFCTNSQTSTFVQDVFTKVLALTEEANVRGEDPSYYSDAINLLARNLRDKVKH